MCKLSYVWSVCSYVCVSACACVCARARATNLYVYRSFIFIFSRIPSTFSPQRAQKVSPLPRTQLYQSFLSNISEYGLACFICCREFYLAYFYVPNSFSFIVLPAQCIQFQYQLSSFNCCCCLFLCVCMCVCVWGGGVNSDSFLRLPCPVDA